MPGVPWRELVGMRNRLAHGYFGINHKILWQVIEVEIPRLQETLQHILNTRPDLFEGQA
jgi:uncharacterized protein with HEPN domain